MKLIGFIKEHNNIQDALSINSFKQQGLINVDEIEKVLDYLNDGVLLLSWLGYFIDIEDDNLISPDSYFTDGIYVWPTYYPYYLKKYSIKYVENDFLIHIIKNDFLINKKTIKEEFKDLYENELSNILRQGG